MEKVVALRSKSFKSKFESNFLLTLNLRIPCIYRDMDTKIEDGSLCLKCEDSMLWL